MKSFYTILLISVLSVFSIAQAQDRALAPTMTMTFDSGVGEPGFTFSNWGSYSGDAINRQNLNNPSTITKTCGTWDAISFDIISFGNGNPTIVTSDQGGSQTFHTGSHQTVTLTGMGWTGIKTLTFTHDPNSNFGISADYDNLVYVDIPPVDPTIPMVTASTDNVCPGTTVTLNINGTLNDASHWTIYSNSCGGTQLGTTAGTTFDITAANGTTNFYVRGEGVCIMPPGSCGTESVTGVDNVLPNISCAAGGSRPVDDGQMTYTVQGSEFDPTGLSDNCGTTNVSNSFNMSSSLAGAMLPIGSNNILWTVNDGNGNSSSCSVVITVEDDSDPIVDGTAGDDAVSVYIDGSETVVVLNGTEVLRRPSMNIMSLTINGGSGNDNADIDFSGGNFPFPITYNGEGPTTNPGDILIVTGNGTQNATFTPSLTTPRDGVLQINGQDITFTGLEPIDISGFGTVTIGGSANIDDLSVANGFDSASGTIPALVISGTINNGVAIESVHAWNNGTLNIVTNAGDDLITVSSANNMHANTNLTFDAGADGGDLIDHNGLVAAAGSLSFISPTIDIGSNLSSNSNTTLTGNINLSANSVITATGDAIFNGGINGNFNLDVWSAGLTRFSANVGANTPLIRLRTDIPGTLTISGSVTTIDNQRFDEPTTINVASTLTASDGMIRFLNGMSATSNLTVNLDQDLIFNQGGSIGGNLIATSNVGTIDLRNQTLTVTGTAVLNGTVHTQANALTTVDISAVSVSVNGTVAPGASVGLLVVTGAFDIGTGDNFDVEINEFNTPGTQYDQLIVNGTVDITDAALNLIDLTTASGVVGDVMTLIDNDLADPIVGTFSGLSEGTILTFNGEPWELSYVGGDGNDVTLSFGAPTLVTLNAGQLRIEDTDDKDDDITISHSGTIYTITDNNGGPIGTTIPGSTGNNTSTVTVPSAGITSVLATLMGGDDIFETDLDSGNFLVPMEYRGGTQTTTDIMVLSGGGTFDTVEHFFANDNDGSIAITGNSTITYTGLEPVFDNLDANNRVFSFTSALDETITLVAGGTLDNQIDSTQGESVDFNNPNVSLTINTEASGGAGNDVVNIEGVDATFDADLSVNAGVGDLVNFQTNPTVLGSGDLMVASSILVVNEDVTTIGTITTTTLRNSSINAGRTVQSSGNMDITTGTAGASGAGYIGLTVNGSMESLATGNITIDASGATPGNFRPGILVGGTGSIQAMGTGAVDLTGNGGINGNSSNGIALFPGATIASNGGGITMLGTAGAGIGTTKVGVSSNNATISDLNGGAISITGTSNGIGTLGKGVRLISTTNINTDGADITITGNGSATSAGTSNYGIELNASAVTATNGNVNLNGTPGSLTAAAINFINAGATATATNTITATATSGEIHTPAGIATSTTFTATNTIINGTFAPGQSPGQVIVSGNYTIGAGDTLEIEVDEFDTAGTEYDQVVVNGMVDITGATLVLVDNTAAIGEVCDSLLIIDNDGFDAVTGEFAGLPNGSDVAFNGETWRIFYDGGTGNDVVLVYMPSGGVFTEVYVNNDFTDPNGTCIVDADPNTAGDQTAVVGVDAFDTIQQGYDAVAAAGNVNITDDLPGDPGEDATSANSLIFDDAPETYMENIVVSKDVTIQATEADFTAVAVDGTGAARVFTVGGGTVVVFSDLTIQNGNGLGSGGGIQNDGNLSVFNSLIQNNNANAGGGIYNDGTFLIDNSTISSNTGNIGAGFRNNSGSAVFQNGCVIEDNISGANGGGLILSFGTLTIDDAIIKNNSAFYDGGGIHSFQPSSTLTITNTLIDGNTTGSRGGGISLVNGAGLALDNTVTVSNNAANGAAGSGGGIFVGNAGSTLNLTGTIIDNNTANRAGGGIEMDPNAGLVTLTDVVLTNNDALLGPGNGGGLHVTGGGDVNITGGIIIDNTANEEGGGLWNGTGTMTIDGTLISSNIANSANNGGDNQGGGGIFNAGGTLDITGATLSGNEALAGLGSGGAITLDGGAMTMTATSVINNFAENAGGGIDNIDGIITLTGSNVDGNTTGFLGGGISSRGTSATTVTGGQLLSNTSDEDGGAIWMSSTANVIVTDALLQGNNANGITPTNGGGAVYNDGGNLSLTGTTLIDGNNANGLNGSGGGIFSNIGGVLNIDGITISNNSASRAGGGIELNTGLLDLYTFNDILLDANMATGAGVAAGNGGGLHVSGVGTVNLNSSIVINNTAVEGGGLWNGAGVMTVTGSAIGIDAIGGGGSAAPNGASGDDPTDGGGGIFNNGGTLTVQGGSGIRYNTATGVAGSGGGILTNGGSLTVSNSVVSDNESNRAGGAIEYSGGTLSLTNVQLNRNQTGVVPGPGAPGNGGGLHITGNLNATLDGLAVRNNFAHNEGGGLWNGSGTMTITNSVIRFNTAESNVTANSGGGGIFNAAGVVTTDANTFITGNNASGSATSSGGGVLNANGTFMATGSLIALNSANRAGGGIEVNGALAVTTLDGVSLNRNDASSTPGNGGGLHITGASNSSITAGTVFSNTAANEGGGLWNGAGVMTLNGVSITENVANSATTGGGGIFNQGGTVTVDVPTIVTNNVADGTGTGGRGGGYFNNTGGTLNIAPGSTITMNYASRAGGAIEDNSGGTLLLDNVTVTFNGAGVNPGFFTGVVTPNPGNGGGVHLSGTTSATLIGGEVGDNLAANEGGGLWNADGTLDITGTLIEDNIASGAAANNGGGGIFNLSGTLNVNAGTIIQDNLADGALGSGGGILSADGDVATTDATIQRNDASNLGGGIELIEGTLTAGNTFIDQNTAGVNGGGVHATGAPTISITGATVEGNSAGEEGGGLWNSATATMSVDTFVINNTASGDAATQGGGGIFNNGGTLTIAPGTQITGNIADGVSGSGGGIFNVSGLLTIDNANIANNRANRAGGGIEAIDGTLDITATLLNTNNAGLAPAVANPGNGGGLHISGSATTNITAGEVQDNTAALEGGGLWNQVGASMSVDGTQITGNIASGDGSDDGGGGIFNSGGSLTILATTLIDNNQADGVSGSGGGVLSTSGVVSITSAAITNNLAHRAGGGIELIDGTLNLTDVSLDDNLAGGVANPGNGGGLHVSGTGTSNITGGTVDSNVAASEGGGLWNQSGAMMTVTGTQIINNTASGAAANNGGGGIFNNGGELNLLAATVIDNNVADGAAGSGGGIFSTDGDLSLTGVVITNNRANRAGGGIELIDGDLTMQNSNLDTNNAGVSPAATANPGNGGGLHVSGLANVDITDGTVNANVAALEGGGLWNGAGQMDVDGTTIDGNTASGDGATQGGGGIFNAGGELNVSDATLSNNVADGISGSGGGILNDGGDLSIDDSTLSGNSSNRAGGAIEHNSGGGTLSLSDTDLLNNSTMSNPGNGGGLHITGSDDADIIGGTISGNSAASEGGGLWNGSGAMEVDATIIDSNTASGGASTEGGGGIFNAGGDLTILDATVSNNVADGISGSGGGILNDGGSLTLEGTTVNNNTSNRAGGGIEQNSAGGTLTLLDSEIIDNVAAANPGNGGGVHITGSDNTTLTGGEVSGNTASLEGGGLWNGSGTMLIDGTTIDGNTASGNGATEGGGGIFNAGGTLGIVDATISNNSADGAAGSGGGILNDGGDLGVTDSEISGNTATRAGGGIEQNSGGGTLVLNEVELLSNMALSAPGNGGGLHITGADNSTIINGQVSGNTAGLEGGGLWNGSGEMNVTGSVITGNTASGDAANEGGGGIFNAGGTLTISAATISTNVADGVSGSGGGILNDLGTLSVTNSTFSGNTSNRAGGAIEDNSLAGNTTTLTGSSLLNNTTASNPGNGGGLHITGAGDSVITGGNINNNTAASEGGGLWNGTGSMLVDGVTLDRNQADGDDPTNGGGAIFNAGGTLTVSNANISNNEAEGNFGSGGAIFNDAGTLTVSDTDITGNESRRAGGGIEEHAPSGGLLTLTNVNLTNNVTSNAPGNGGGLHITGSGDADITGGSVTGNEASAEGGGLWNDDGLMTIVGTDISSNSASGGSGSNGGGGLFNDGGDLSLSDVIMNDNLADGLSGSGGALFSTNGSITLSNGSLSGNSANRAGGAIEIVNGDVTITDSQISGNDVNGTAGAPNPGNGGGLHVSGNAAVVTLRDSEINNNVAAKQGGGLWNQSGSLLSVEVSTIDTNTSFGAAPDDGGAGIYNNGGMLEVSDSTISGNQAAGAGSSGGGLHNASGGSMMIVTSTLSSNVVSGSGGGLYNNGASADLNAVTIANNTVSGTGGGIQSDSSTSLKNTLVATNSATSAMDVGGSFISNDYNLIGTDDTGAFPAASNDLEEVDAFLGPLQNNGGTTQTHELMAGSLAYNNGDPADTFDDQIGQSVFSTARDIGAFEAQSILLGVEETADGGFAIKVYPNPSPGASNISIPASFGNDITLTIFSGSGKLVRQEKLSAGISELGFDSLQDGVYLLQLVSEDHTSTHRVIVAKQ